jgi:hypothetical protein
MVHGPWVALDSTIISALANVLMRCTPSTHTGWEALGTSFITVAPGLAG